MWHVYVVDSDSWLCVMLFDVAGKKRDDGCGRQVFWAYLFGANHLSGGGGGC